jgi:Na+/H+ antiporter NhaD/arsenite permease-like protein
VATLSEIGVLTAVGEWLDTTVGNDYLVTGAIGVLSSIVDNVPLVAGAMKMYTVTSAEMLAANPELANLAVDGVFWQLLAYCAGVGGSMLIIGSAAGVVVMGLERISFGWYMKNITWIAFVGYLAGLLCYWVMNTLL